MREFVYQRPFFALLVIFVATLALIDLRQTAVTRIDNLEVANYVQLTSSTGPTIKPISSNPNGVVTEPRGSVRFRIDSNNASIWQNTDGGTTWVRVDLSATTTGDTPVNTPGDFFYGTGFDGDCNFDGVATPVCGASRSGSTYTLPRNLYAEDIIIAAGVRIDTGQRAIFATGTISGTGVVSANGNNASGTTGGTARAANYLPGGLAGLNGSTGNCGTGGSQGTFPIWCAVNSAANGGAAQTGGTNGTACRGGGGGGGNASSGGEACKINSVTAQAFILQTLFVGRTIDNTIFDQHSNGGCGGGDGTAGGGGGGGAGWVGIVARNCSSGWTVEAKGGNGGSPVAGNRGGGGGGAGGTVIVYCGAGTAPTATITPGTGANGTGNGGKGGDGGVGHKAIYSPATGWVHGTS